MNDKWIIDVLSDMKAFARQNDLPALADQLEDAALVAAAEIASKTEGVPARLVWENGSTERIYRKARGV